MGGFLFDELRMCFEHTGYSINRVIGTGPDKVFFAYKEYNKVLYTVIVSYCMENDSLQKEAYEYIVQNYLNTVSKKRYGDMRFLQLVYTDNRCNADYLINEMPFWIINPSTRKLIIYENQPQAFFDTANVIDDALYGEHDYSGKPGVVKNRYKIKRDIHYIPIVTITLILINALVFIVMEIMGDTDDVNFMLEHGALSYHETIELGQYYRFVTHFFMHFGYEHIISNMLILGVFGYYLERMIKKFRFAFIYMTSGIVAGAVSMTFYQIIGETHIVSAGASAAIFGICGAMFVLLVLNRKLFASVGIGRIIMFLILMLYNGYGNDQAGNVAHVVGFVVGVVIMSIMYGFSRKLRAAN